VSSRARIVVMFWFVGPVLATMIVPRGLETSSLFLTVAAAALFSHLAAATIPRLACPRCRRPSFRGVSPSLGGSDGCESCGINAP
jgi:hypothetical protein